MQDVPSPLRLFERVRIAILEPVDFPHSGAFREFAFGLQAAFTALGAKVDTATNELLADKGVNIVFGAHMLARADALPPNSVVVNLEQMRTSWAAGVPHYPDLLRRHPVVDYSHSNASRIRELTGNPHVHVLKPGYMPQLTSIPVAQEQDIDVLQYGVLNERRRRILEALKAQGLVVQHLLGIYGKERDQWIARSKVVLNVHFYGDKIHEIIRTSWLLANRKAVVSECDPDTEIDTDVREAIIGVPYDELVQTCIDLVRDDVRRREVERNGFEIFSRRNQAEMLAELLPKLSLALPGRINLGNGKAYDPERRNIDIETRE